jgi:hypothetical protein
MSSEPKKEDNLARNVISVDMDDRAFLIPETKNIAQLRFSALPEGVVSIEFIYAHNINRLPPSKIILQHADAKSFCLRLIDAVYRAQTQNAISESAHITITMVTNGYIFIIKENGTQRQFYMSPNVIWRVCNALCQIVDIQSPILSH